MNKRSSGGSRFVRWVMVFIGMAFVIGSVLLVQYITAGTDVLF